MEMKNVKISVDNLEELLAGENESEIIDIMRQALIAVRDSEGHYDLTKEIEKQKIEDPAIIAKMQKEATSKEEKLEKGLLNGDKFNMFRPSCFGKISYSHLTRTLKSYGYQVSQKGNCISDEKMTTVSFERLQKLEEIERKYTGKNDDNKGDKTMETNNNLSATEKLAVNYVSKSEEYKEQDVISIRCATSVQTRLKSAYEKYRMFPKQYLLSYLLDIALTELENSEGK